MYSKLLNVGINKKVMFAILLPRRKGVSNHFAARGGPRTGRDLGPAGFEAIHTGFKCSNIGFERRYSLVELRKRKPHQRPHLFKFIPELIAQTLQLMPNRGVTFSDLSDIASE